MEPITKLVFPLLPEISWIVVLSSLCWTMVILFKALNWSSKLKALDSVYHAETSNSPLWSLLCCQVDISSNTQPKTLVHSYSEGHLRKTERSGREVEEMKWESEGEKGWGDRRSGEREKTDWHTHTISNFHVHSRKLRHWPSTPSVHSPWGSIPLANQGWAGWTSECLTGRGVELQTPVAV